MADPRSSPAAAARPASASRAPSCWPELGARVTITSTTDRIEARAGELRAAGATVHAHVADLTDPGQARALVAAAEAAHGPLDVLVNNAGLAQTGRGAR